MFSLSRAPKNVGRPRWLVLALSGYRGKFGEEEEATMVLLDQGAPGARQSWAYITSDNCRSIYLY